MGPWTPALFVWVLVAIVAAPSAHAADFTVNPIQIFLGGQVQSAILTARNASGEPLRFQLNVFAWSQDPTGQMRLAPTTDIIFFPRLLTLAPGEQRIVRVGTAAPPGPVERTYRLFVEELPAVATEATPPGAVRVLARLGIPIFVQPTVGRPELRLGRLSLQAGRMIFELRNAGTKHVVPHEVHVRGLDASGGPVWERALDGWYVLAGESRIYHVALGRDECVRTRTVVVDVTAGEQVLTERLDVPTQHCGP